MLLRMSIHKLPAMFTSGEHTYYATIPTDTDTTDIQYSKQDALQMNGEWLTYTLKKHKEVLIETERVHITHPLVPWDTATNQSLQP